MRRASYEICRRRSDDHHARLARELDVVKSVPGAEDLGVDRSASHCFERDGTDELASTASHHDVYFSTCLCKQTRQPH